MSRFVWFLTISDEISCGAYPSNTPTPAEREVAPLEDKDLGMGTNREMKFMSLH